MKTLGHLAGIRRVARAALRPPLRDLHFWTVQSLIVAIMFLHWIHHEWFRLPLIGIPHFASFALLMLPVVYAALTFGLSGAVATAAWVSALGAPFVVFGTWHSRIEDGVQLAVVVVAALLVGHRVDLERRARDGEQYARDALRTAERRYRTLFESNRAPILVADLEGVVREANPAAAALFPGRTLKGGRLRDLMGPAVAEQITTLNPPALIEVPTRSGVPISFRPFATSFGDQGQQLLMAVLQDVTEELREQHLMRTYAAQVMAAQEEERRRIAQELHDDPLQSLLYLTRRLRAFPDQDSLAPPAAAVLEEAQSVSAEIASHLRELARGLLPPSLQDLGLVPALRQLMEELRERAGIEASLSVDGQVRRLRQEAELGLFRITQEALHNVERHAGARRVSVSVAFQADTVSLSVSDDGVGMELPLRGAPGERAQTMGLAGMRERAAVLGARFVIHSRPGRGTEVNVCLPGEAASPAAATHQATSAQFSGSPVARSGIGGSRAS